MDSLPIIAIVGSACATLGGLITSILAVKRINGRQPQPKPVSRTEGVSDDWTKETVDVLIVYRAMPLDNLRRTVQAAMAMEGRHRTWIIDEAKSDLARDLAGGLGCHYIRRLSLTGGDAGSINYALSIAKGQFVVLVPTGSEPRSDFLWRTIPLFSQPQVGVVRTSPSPSLSKRWHRLVNGLGKDVLWDTVVVYRRVALNDIGGLPTQRGSQTVEKLLASRGWKSASLTDVSTSGNLLSTPKATDTPIGRLSLPDIVRLSKLPAHRDLARAVLFLRAAGLSVKSVGELTGESEDSVRRLERRAVDGVVADSVDEWLSDVLNLEDRSSSTIFDEEEPPRMVPSTSSE